jgi:polyhydroxyalkanoate synthesis regulator protein
MKIDPDVMAAVLRQLENNAREQEKTAVCQGDWGDSGAALERQLVKFYRYGMQGIIPPDWEHMYKTVADKVELEKNPEYKEYLRLRAKFG